MTDDVPIEREFDASSQEDWDRLRGLLYAVDYPWVVWPEDATGWPVYEGSALVAIGTSKREARTIAAAVNAMSALMREAGASVVGDAPCRLLPRACTRGKDQA